MALSRNPTKTRTIERAWLREVGRRWARFRNLVIKRLREMNDGTFVNAQAPFDMDPSQQRIYMAYVEQQINDVLVAAQLGVDGATNWQARYQLESYRRGLETTRAALVSQGAGIRPTEAERLAAQGLATFSAVPTLSTGAISVPIHQDALAFLTGRSYTDLKGWTDALAKQTRQILFDAVEQGKGIDTVTKEITQRIEVSKSRAQLIARTEVNQAYGRAAVAEAQRAGDEIDEPVNLRWLTVRDTRVRHMHAEWHGVVMTPDKAAANKNKSPWNCRCGFAPVIPEADTQAKAEKFEAERKQLLAEESQDG